MAEKITIDEIKSLIKEEKLKPSRLFGIDDLAEDPIVKGIAEEERRDAVISELTHRKRLGKRFEGSEEDWEKEKTKFEDENKKLKIKIAKQSADNLFTSKMKDRKLDKLQIDYIKERKDKFEPIDPEKTKEEVDTFLDGTLESYKKDAKIFGHKADTTLETKGGAEEGEGGEENPFIP